MGCNRLVGVSRVHGVVDVAHQQGLAAMKSVGRVYSSAAPCDPRLRAALRDREKRSAFYAWILAGRRGSLDLGTIRVRGAVSASVQEG